MKRKQLVRIACLMWAVLFLLLPVSARAAAKDDIGRYDVTVRILKNGDANVTHHVTYNLSRKAHQLTLPQSISGIDDACLTGITVESGSRKTRLKHSALQKSGTYETRQVKNHIEITTYGNYGTNPLKFTYACRLNGLVTNYRDCAEVNWQAVSSRLNVPQRNVGIHFILPQKNVKFLRIWNHGSLDDARTNVSFSRGRVDVTLKKNPAHQSLKCHLLFPASVTSKNSKLIRQHMRENIEKAEDARIEKAERKRERKKDTYNLIRYVWLGIVVLSIFLWFLRLFRHPIRQKTALPELEYSYDLPKFPAEFAEVIMTDSKPTPRAFAAYLLELAFENKVTIETVPNTKNDFYVKLVDKSILHDNELLRLLFGRVGKRGRFTLKDLETFAEEDGQRLRLSSSFDKWAGNVFQHARNTGYYDNAGERSTRGTCIWCIANIPLTVACICMFLDQLYIAIPLALLILACGLVLSRLYRNRETYTATGITARYKLLCLQKTFEDIRRMNLEPVKDKVLHEQLVPYSIVFGSSRNTIKALKTNFPAKRLQIVFEAYYFPVFIFSDGDYAASLSEGLMNAIAPKKVDKLNTNDDLSVRFKRSLIQKLKK